MKHLFAGLGAGIIILGSFAIFAEAAKAPVQPVYEGIVTQFNLGDGSFTLRQRDGSLLTVQNPFAVGAFVRVKGTLSGGVLNQVPQIQILDPASVPPIPAISVANPGTGEVGTQVVLTGSGFTRWGNSVDIGSVQNAVINLPSRDGSTLTFSFPAAPCNQKTTTACPTAVIAPGLYDLKVRNKNGVSDTVSFQVLPLPELGITTDILPQAQTGTYYRTDIEGIGGAEKYNWKVTGNLPSGMFVVETACQSIPCKSPERIYGWPQQAGTYNFTVTLSSGSEVIARQFLLTVVQSLSQGY